MRTTYARRFAAPFGGKLFKELTVSKNQKITTKSGKYIPDLHTVLIWTQWFMGRVRMKITCSWEDSPRFQKII